MPTTSPNDSVARRTTCTQSQWQPKRRAEAGSGDWAKQNPEANGNNSSLQLYIETYFFMCSISMAGQKGRRVVASF